MMGLSYICTALIMYDSHDGKSKPINVFFHIRNYTIPVMGIVPYDDGLYFACYSHVLCNITMMGIACYSHHGKQEHVIIV